MTPIHHKQLSMLIGRALALGAERLSLASFLWNIAGDCSSPYQRTVMARPPPVRGERKVVIGRRTASTLWLTIETRCRKCARCRKSRSNMWRFRAITEWRQSARTWFITLTLQDSEQFRFLCQARSREAKQGIDFDALPEVEQFHCRVREIGRELTLMFKRLRKETKAPLRYLCVVERHRSGAPHFHILLHEVDVERPVTKAVIQKHWRLGFSTAKLVSDPYVAGYVCKYLSKDAAARVRASQRYGSLENALSLKNDMHRELRPELTSRENKDPQILLRDTAVLNHSNERQYIETE